METARTFKIDNYITVPGFAIVELGLSGNELLCYSLIYGFTQDRETEFRGSLNYVASALNVTKQNAKKIIDRLVDRGLVDKREMFFSGVKFCHYVAKDSQTATALLKQQRGVAETATGGVAETATNNNMFVNKSIDNNIPADGGLFPGEDIEKKKKLKGTTENLCLFADSRYSDFNTFCIEFSRKEFENVDIAYYFEAVKDWSAQRGKKMKDWIATARNFMRRDLEERKLHILQNPQMALSPDALKYLQEMA